MNEYLLLPKGRRGERGSRHPLVILYFAEGGKGEREKKRRRGGPQTLESS